MGGSVSQVFRSGSALLSHRDGHKVSKLTEERLQSLFEILCVNPKVPLRKVESLLLDIPRNENILVVHDEWGYNILQRCVGLNHVELTRWLLHRHRPDVNRSPCSLPLHIACQNGFEACVEALLRHGARIDAEACMCYPGVHLKSCEENGKYRSHLGEEVTERCVAKMHNAIWYAIAGDQINVLNILTQKMEEPWLPFRAKKPLLHLACANGAWKCVQQLAITRSEEINLITDEYYPIHHVLRHDGCFLELLINHGAMTTVRTCTQQMTVLHMVIYAARKNAVDTQSALRILLERGCKELINEPDSLGNTPLHALIGRYALEEVRYDYAKWTKWDILHLTRFMLQNGAKNSINQAGNSALACVFRHVRDWDVCYELLGMLIRDGGDPNIVGRDGSVPIMVLLVHLINKEQLHHFTHSMKMCYLNCLRILLQHGANPNYPYRANLKPLYVLVFTLSENFTLNDDIQKRVNFDFIKNILLLLLQHGLDCNETYQHILQAVMDTVQNVRTCDDMLCVYELTLTLIQYGANPNIVLSTKTTSGTAIFSDEIANYRESLCKGNGSNGNSGAGSSTGLSESSLRNSFRTNSRYILFYCIIFVTRKEFILNDPNLNYTRLIYLFFFTMQHEPLYNCLKSLHNFYVAQVPSKKTEQLTSLISTLYRRPRSLKQLARLAIYEAVDRKLAININRLTLPGPLREYVLQFQR